MLARIYDAFDADRDDLDLYVDLVGELEARHVLDIGCGTGSLPVLLTRSGITVTGVDPAAASLDVARDKDAADQVTWIHGDAMTLPSLQVDLAVMTGNVAQVFLTNDDGLGRCEASGRPSSLAAVWCSRRGALNGVPGKIGPSTPAPSFETCPVSVRSSSVGR